MASSCIQNNINNNDKSINDSNDRKNIDKNNINDTKGSNDSKDKNGK